MQEVQVQAEVQQKVTPQKRRHDDEAPQDSSAIKVQNTNKGKQNLPSSELEEEEEPELEDDEGRNDTIGVPIHLFQLTDRQNM